jgi:amino acid adenylation domain-containing protein
MVADRTDRTWPAWHPATTIHQLVEHAATRLPDAVAVSMDGRDLSYRDLVSRATDLAGRLQDRGVVPESRVALAVPRSVEFVIAALAVLKAGGAYVPIDPAYPPGRQAFMLEDSDARLIVVDGPDAPLSGHPQALVLTEAADSTGGSRVPPDRRFPAVTPDNLAYLIYTSGSTGVPKGVSITHAAVVDLLTSDPRLAIGTGDVVAHLAPTAFDASTFEIWGPLVAGGRIAVIADRHVSAQELGARLREIQPDWMFLTTGLFHLLVDYDPAALNSVGVLLAGGDALSPKHVLAAAKEIGRQVYAVYGPTETTVFASCHAVEVDGSYDRVPLGTALAGSSMLVLNERLEELPVGEVGEIFLRGPGLARGYHRRPAFTAERFIADPGSSPPGARLYRTGDRGRRLPEGDVEFLGRVDRQVKLRGFRVEPGEVEAALNAHPAVGSSAVVVVSDGGGQRLVAYVAPRRSTELTAGQLRGWLAERLPAYLLPNNYALIPQLPLDPNGKIDRTALPAPWQVRAQLDGQLTLPPFSEPGTPTERLVANAFVDALQIDQVGRHDNFFEFGGDSLRSVEVLEQLKKQGIVISTRQFFGNATVAGVAGLVDLAGAPPNGRGGSC